MRNGINMFLTEIFLLLLALAHASCGKQITIDNVDGSVSTSITLAQNPFRQLDRRLNNDDAARKSQEACQASQGCTTRLGLRINALDLVDQSLFGYVGQPLTWVFVVQDEASEKRNLKIFLHNLPVDAAIDYGDPSLTTAKLTWTPKNEMRNEKKLEIYARDLDMCEKTNLESSRCKEEVFNEKYDHRESYDWQILAKQDGNPSLPGDNSKEGSGIPRPEEPPNPDEQTTPGEQPKTFNITYEGNGNTGGVPPVDNSSYKSGDLAIVLGNSNQMTKAGQSFAGWNTRSDASGIGYKPGQAFPIADTNVILYGVWRSCNFSRTTGTLIGGRCGGRDRFIQEARSTAAQNGCSTFCWSMSCPRGVKDGGCESI